MWKCIKCGTEGNEDGKACMTCNHVLVPETLILHAADEKAARLKITSRLNQAWAKRLFGEDARYWDPEHQMTIQHRTDGWFVCPNPAAANETLLDGVRVSDSAELKAGAVLAIGREAKRIAKTPLKIAFE